MKNEIITTKLAKNYIQVEGFTGEKREKTFGGNQDWFGEIDRKWKGNAIKGFGCGLIGAADVLMYLQRGVSGMKTSRAENGALSISKDEYMSYIQRLERKYFHILPKLGLSGVLMSLGVNVYLAIHYKEIKAATGHRYIAKWAVWPTKLLTRIKEMLSNDIPVVISMGPGFFHKNKVKFYKRFDNGDDSRMVFKPVTSTKDHYVTVTGVIEKDDQVMLEISSWGIKYYINFDEYKAYVRKNDNYFFSNILYIKRF